MRADVIERLLVEGAGAAKEISPHNGVRFVIRYREQWSTGDVLTLLMHGEFVYVAYLSVATIRILR